MALRKRKGVAAASDAVVVIEGVKAALRLALMRTTGGRTAVQPPIAEREVDPALLEAHKDEVLAVPTRVRSGAGGAPRSAADVLLGGEEGESVEEEHKEYWKGARTGYARPTIASIRVAGDAVVGDPTSTGGKESVQQYLLTRVLTVEDVKRPEDLVARAKGLGKVAEIIWIMRPLLYGAFFLIPSLPWTNPYFAPSPDSPCDAQVWSSTHPPLPPLPRPRVPRLLPPPDLRDAPRRNQSFRADAPQFAERGRARRDEEAREGVLVVPRSGTGLGELDQVSRVLRLPVKSGELIGVRFLQAAIGGGVEEV